jgi:hypothetical protein
MAIFFPFAVQRLIENQFSCIEEEGKKTSAFFKKQEIPSALFSQISH